MTKFCISSWIMSKGMMLKKVTLSLTKNGHNVYTPTLTGLGERSHLISRNIGLDTHILDIIQALEYKDSDEVTLVGLVMAI